MTLSFAVTNAQQVLAQTKATKIAVTVSCKPWITDGLKQPRRTSQVTAANSIGVDEKSYKGKLRKYSNDLPSIVAVNRVRSAVEAYLKSATTYCAYTDLRFLDRTDLATFEATMQQFAADCASTAADVQTDRYTILADAKRRLNGEYDDNDYPGDLSAGFAVTWTYPTVGVDQSLPEAVRNEKEQQLATRVAIDAQNAELDLLERFQDLAVNLETVLRLRKGEPGSKWHQSTIDNLVTFRDKVTKLSLLQTPFLTNAVQEAYSLCAGLTHQDCKADPIMSAQVADLLRAILTKTGAPIPANLPPAPTPAPVSVPQSVPVAGISPEEAARAAQAASTLMAGAPAPLDLI